MKRLLLGLALAGLLLPVAATAGGFATVQLSSLPAGTDAGGTWTPTMMILQHGVTPLDGLQRLITGATLDRPHDQVAPPLAAPRALPLVTDPAAGTTVLSDDPLAVDPAEIHELEIVDAEPATV